ncbi:MAG TPA: N-acetylneuraminate synthase family protein [Methylophilus sp.]|nr:N-acetylneuraminate synthase family protein [Methylophilus sp.]HQQ33327.1 N-acetylneuraminate synthase family protein [Methylophilus sp.]
MIQDFSQVEYKNKHIKFQPFCADTISMPDYEWYGVYQKLYFSHEEWGSLIDTAFQHFEGVWIDLFDLYGVEILDKNLNKIIGIKLQASVLGNQEVLNALRGVSLSGKALMLNVSGYELSEIESFINDLKTVAPLAQLILQIGFQAYPTNPEDTGLQKIPVLRAAFPEYEICIADHVAAESDLATVLPLLAVARGCTLVEKHIVHNRSTAEYDKFSALELEEMQLLASRLSACPQMLEGPFISNPEKQYLAKSIQVPILGKKVAKGSLLAPSDFIFRRTNKTGNTFSQIVELQAGRRVLERELAAGDTVDTSDFKHARVGAIVACRMKSTRLKNKATLLINGKPSVERCLANALKIKGVDEVILATSDLEEDAILKDYTLGEKVHFWQGDPDDVILRYLGACDHYDIDVIVRITADCPAVSSEIAEYLLAHHFRTGADYTAAKDYAVGTACEIYNAEALRRVIKYLGSAMYSEYMTWYMQNNADIFKVELVDLPDSYVRNYRLTLDYPEDLELFTRVYEELDSKNKEATLENVFGILDLDQSLAKINSHLVLKYKTDTELIERLNKVTRITKN